jgi:exosortase/archaeosortase family protein
MKNDARGVVHSFFTRTEIRVFLFRFFLIFILAEFTLYYFPPIPYQEWLASSMGEWFSLPTHEIWVPVTNGNFEITPSCTGITSAALFVGLVYGFPRLPKNKGMVALAGVFLLLVLNYFRLLLVIGTGEIISLPAAELVHVFSWFVLSGIALGMWFAFIQKETGEKNWRRVGRALLRASSH